MNFRINESCLASSLIRIDYSFNKFPVNVPGNVETILIIISHRVNELKGQNMLSIIF